MRPCRHSLLIPLALALLSLPRPLAGAAGDALMTITPCRAVDTRNPVGPHGGPALGANVTRTFTLTGTCSLPPDALALAVNITVVLPAASGFAQLYAGDATAPQSSVLSFSAGRTRASNAIVALASDGSGTVALANVSAGAADFILDVTGFFVTTCPPPPPPVITPTPARVCAGSTGNTASGPAATTWAWTITNGTITSAANIQTITYTAGTSGSVGLTLVVTNASTCSAESSLNVPIDAIPAPPVILTSNPQTFTVSGASGTFTLTFNGQTTSSLAFDASAAQVQTALNALSSIGGAGGSATVTLTGGFFTVTFGGTLAGPQPQLTASGSGGCTVSVDLPAVCANSTGNQARGPAGATTYAWSITNGAITSATNIQTITYTAGSSGSVGLTLVVTNGPTCVASNGINVPINASPATPTIAAGNPQTFTVSGVSGTFTLTFGGQTTSTLAFDATAADVQTALNTLSSIGGAGGSAAVTQAGNVYTVTFGGTLTGPQPQLTASGAGGCTVVVDPPAVCGGSTGNLARGPAGATTYAWSITNGTITSASDIQTITYTAGPSGNVGLTLVVTNASHCPAQDTLNVLINASPLTPVINPTPAQVCANSTGNTADGPAGAASYAWSVSNGTITSAANIQTITYTAGPSGSVTLNLTVTNASGCSAASAPTNVPINPTPAFTPAAGALPVATFNVAYSLTFAGTGGTGPYTFALASGALPAGMTLNANGTVSPNTPSVTGPFAFSITVTDANNCSSAQAYTLNVQPNLQTDAYAGVGNTQFFITGVAGAPTTPAVSSATTVLANDTPAGGIAVTAGTTACTGSGGGSITMDALGRFIYTPAVGGTGTATCNYTGASNGISATGTINITLSGMVWWVDNATASGTNDGRSNTPFKTMTAVNGAATNNGDFIYVFKGSGTTTGAYTMKPSQQLIGAGATLNVPTISPLVTIAGVDGNTPTIGDTITLAGNVTVAGIDMNTDASNGIAGTSVSGVTVTARNVATTTGTGVTIGGSGNSGTFLFRSIASNGAVNGISLTNTTGSFTVTGDGASDPADTTRGRTTAKLGGGSLTLGSGGTIQGTTGSGIILNNTGAVILRNMTIFNPSVGGQVVNSGANGITATSVNGLTLDNVFINGFTGNSGLRGIPAGSAASITNLVLQHVDIDGNGTAVGTETNNNWNVRIDELAGNCGNGTAGCGWNNSLFFNSRENVFFITQGVTDTTVSTSMTITNCEFRDTTTFASPANDAFGISAFNNAVTNVTATGSTFKNVEVGGFQYNGNDNASGIVNVRNSIFENTGSDILLAHGGGSGGNSTLTFDVSGNTTRQLTGNPASTVAFNFFLAGNSGAGSLMIGKIENNTIGNPAVVGSGSHVGDGIDVNATGAGTITATVTGNTVRQIHQGEVFFGEANSGSAKLNLFVHGNTFNTDTGTSAFGLDALDLAGGAVPSDTSTVCADVAANVLVGDNNYTSVVVQTIGSALSGVNLAGMSATFNDDTTAIANFMGSSGATTPPGVNTSTTPAPTSSFMVIGGGHVKGVASCGVTFP